MSDLGIHLHRKCLFCHVQGYGSGVSQQNPLESTSEQPLLVIEGSKVSLESNRWLEQVPLLLCTKESTRG